MFIFNPVYEFETLSRVCSVFFISWRCHRGRGSRVVVAVTRSWPMDLDLDIIWILSGYLYRYLWYACSSMLGGVMGTPRCLPGAGGGLLPQWPSGESAYRCGAYLRKTTAWLFHDISNTFGPQPFPCVVDSFFLDDLESLSG